MADAVVYFITSHNIVYAVDATSGKEVWRYDPREAEVLVGNGGNENGPITDVIGKRG